MPRKQFCKGLNHELARGHGLAITSEAGMRGQEGLNQIRVRNAVFQEIG
jgi:hypothetical protein